MTTRYFYYVVFYNGCIYKDIILDSDQFAGCKFIDEDKFVAAGCPHWEGLILRVSANKQDLEKNLQENPIDLLNRVQIRFPIFPSTRARSTVEGDKNSKVETPQNTTTEHEPMVTKINTAVHENATPIVQNERDSKTETSEHGTLKPQLTMPEGDTRVDKTVQSTSRDNANSEGQTRKQKTMKRQQAMSEIDTAVVENASPPRSKLHSTHRIETMRKKKLEISREKLPSADENIEKSERPQENDTNKEAKKEAEAQNAADDSDDMSIYKRYKVYKRRSINPDHNSVEKVPEKEMWQGNVPIISECEDEITTFDLQCQSSIQATEKIKNHNPNAQFESIIEVSDNELSRNKIDATPQSNNDFDEIVEIDIPAIPPINPDAYVNTEPENEVFSDEHISRRLWERKFMELSVKYEKLKRQCQRSYHLNKLLYKFIRRMNRSSYKILKYDNMSSLTRYVSGFTSRSINDDDSDDMEYIDMEI